MKNLYVDIGAEKVKRLKQGQGLKASGGHTPTQTSLE